MDTSSPTSTEAPLSVDSAAEAFGNLLDPPKVEAKTPEALEAEAIDAEAAKAVESDEGDAPETEAEAADADSEKVTIEVDGKTVELTKAELADAYKNGLRQADYTKKTMEAAEVRKTAEAETARARQERDNYAQGLQKNTLQLQAVLEQQQSIDWNALLDADPVEFLKQKHLFDQRQAAFQQNVNQLQTIQEQNKAEQAEFMAQNRAAQQDLLLAKLPEWKNPERAKAEAEQIKTYLKAQGFDESDLANINDHRAVLLGVKAMKYDQIVANAKAAAKKVQSVPQKVVRPGVGDTPNLDRRTSQMKQLSKTGRVEDAAALFSSFV